MIKHFLSLLLICGPAFLLAGCDSHSSANSAGGGESLPAISLEDGKKVYTQYCAACHQADGGGVPNMQPSLIDNAVVKGDTKVLVGLVIYGPDKVLPADRERYSNVMPPFGGALSDEQVAGVLSYLRKEYGGGSSAIDLNTVKTVRATPPKPQS